MNRKLKLAGICMGVAALALSGCSQKEKHSAEEQWKVRCIAYRQAQDMDVKQLIDALLLETYNDTVKLCEALIMPKETFTRLARKESTPTAIGLERLRDLFILTNTYGNPFLESCAEYGRERKAEFANDENRLRLISVWEEQADTGIKKGSGILS
jgi:hypothetical protein